MNEDVSVVIAYRDLGVPERAASFEFVAQRYLDLHFEVVVVSDVEPFGRAAAINEGVRRASGAVIVQSDPDSLVPVGQLADGINFARAADGLVVPHDRYVYASQATTAQILAGQRDVFSLANEWDAEEVGTGVGNVTVFSRSTWAAAGGFDERFGVWGGDDAAFAYACDAICGAMRRVPGDMVHLWHPRLPQSEPGHPMYVEQFAILAEYRDAAAVGPDAVRAIVAGLRA